MIKEKLTDLLKGLKRREEELKLQLKWTKQDICEVYTKLQEIEEVKKNG